VHGGGGLRVGVQGHGDRAVAEDLLHDLGVYPSRQQQRGGGVA
jgi:hypothetical protein